MPKTNAPIDFTLTLLVIVRHTDNIKRLCSGTEKKFMVKD